MTLEQYTYVLAGQLRAVTGTSGRPAGETADLSAGDLLLTLPGESLQFINEGTETARVLFICAPPYPNWTMPTLVRCASTAPPAPMNPGTSAVGCMPSAPPTPRQSTAVWPPCLASAPACRRWARRRLTLGPCSPGSTANLDPRLDPHGAAAPRRTGAAALPAGPCMTFPFLPFDGYRLVQRPIVVHAYLRNRKGGKMTALPAAQWGDGSLPPTSD
ncbi:MAG: cupin domain-containing protein [Dehalococcoidia bacterium]